ncbi:hypothetical protein PAPHI01_1401 [Pancytospora philotis]|nr:hypothetical protein PAPHI01_1401 [Pancytospora philotis]
MRPVCRYYMASECLNDRCRFAHPPEYPVYIYATGDSDIHPDELRYGLMMDPGLAAEADKVWVDNYVQFCQLGEGVVDIVENPDYFCMPFDVDGVSGEVERLKRAGKLAPRAQGADRPRYDRPPERGGQGRGGYGGQFDRSNSFQGGSFNRSNSFQGGSSSRNNSFQGGNFQGNNSFQGSNFQGGAPPRSNSFQGSSTGRNSFQGAPPKWGNQDRNDQGGWGSSFNRGGASQNRFDGQFGGNRQGGGYGRGDDRFDRQGQQRYDGQGPSQQQGGGRWGGQGQSRGAQGGGWFAGKGGRDAPQDGQQGFDRPRGSPAAERDDDNTPDYSYRNVPYNYK